MGAWIWYLVRFLLIFVPLYRVVVEFPWYVVEFCLPFVDFQSCFNLVFLRFVIFCHVFARFGGVWVVSFPFCSFFILVNFGLASVNSSQNFLRLFPFRVNSLPISFKFWAMFCQFLRIYMIAGDFANICVNISWLNVVYCRFLFKFWPFWPIFSQFVMILNRFRLNFWSFVDFCSIFVKIGFGPFWMILVGY